MNWDGSVGDHGGWCCLSSAPRGLRYVSPRRNSHHPSPATRPITTAAVRTGRRRRTARKGCVGRTSMPSRFSRRPIVPGCASAPRRATGSPRSRTSTVSPAMSRASWTRPVVRARWADANGPEARRRRPARRLERSTTIRSPVPRMSMSSPSTANWRSARTSRGRAMSVAGGCQHLLSRDRINYRVRHRLEMKKWRALFVGGATVQRAPGGPAPSDVGARRVFRNDLKDARASTCKGRHRRGLMTSAEAHARPRRADTEVEARWELVYDSLSFVRIFRVPSIFQ